MLDFLDAFAPKLMWESVFSSSSNMHRLYVEIQPENQPSNLNQTAFGSTERLVGRTEGPDWQEMKTMKLLINQPSDLRSNQTCDQIWLTDI